MRTQQTSGADPSSLNELRRGKLACSAAVYRKGLCRLGTYQGKGMDNLVVSEVFEITGRGIGVFFENDPTPSIPWQSYHVRVTKPNGEKFETTGHVELARKISSNDVMALYLPNLKKSQVPRRSLVHILGPVASKDVNST